VEQERGRRFGRRPHGATAALASAALGDHLLARADVYAGTTSPGGHGNPANSRTFGLIEGVQLNSYFDRGTITWRDRHARLEVGHTWLRWGPGLWGTMALSDGAPGGTSQPNATTAP